MIERLDVGVIGLGFFSLHHSLIFTEHLSAELAGICDSNPARTRDAARTTGAPGFADYSALLGLPRLQAVSICLPDRLHEEAAIAAAEAGKAILLERPFAHSASPARRILEAVDHNRVRLMVARSTDALPASLTISLRPRCPGGLTCGIGAKPSTRSPCSTRSRDRLKRACPLMSSADCSRLRTNG